MDISGVDKVKLLRELWTRQQVATFFTSGFGQMLPIPVFDENLAFKAVTQYIDYFQGRAIKADLSEDTVSIDAYERDAGRGKFAEAIKAAISLARQTRPPAPIQ